VIDATGFPENIKHPNDVGLINDVREWLVDNIKKMGKAVGKTFRTKLMEGRKEYFNYSKKKKKTINTTKMKMLQLVKWKLRQMKEGIEIVKALWRRIKTKYS